MVKKIWQTNEQSLHPLVDAYTVGEDFQIDQQLLGYDIQASKAHVLMLGKTNILSKEDVQALITALTELRKAWESGLFVVSSDFEDGHSAIEAYLIDKLGDKGKKIHTARSRNDQSLVMMRLLLKDRLEQVCECIAQLSDVFQVAVQKHKNVSMPGYTHMQRAMPTTAGLWLGSYGDAYSDLVGLVRSVHVLIDQNPLGSVAGFGVDLPIDREATTKTLGFAKTQDNPLYCGLSRGYFEFLCVQALVPAMTLAGKFAFDMLLFSTAEFGFVSLPDTFTTGSSVMPQKHNYDLFEIMRGKAHAFSSYSQQLQSIVAGVGSGYNRDYQLTKSITMDAFNTCLSTLELLTAVIPELILDTKRMSEAISQDMNSVSMINKLVEQGIPFRDAYMTVKQQLEPERNQ